MLGERPKTICAFQKELEREWVTKVAVDLNSCLNMGLATDLKMNRKAEELCKARGEEEKL